jgi:hypothetical protein
LPETEKADFGELLVVGSFDDSSDEEIVMQQKAVHWNGHVIEDGGYFTD